MHKTQEYRPEADATKHKEKAAEPVLEESALNKESKQQPPPKEQDFKFQPPPPTSISPIFLSIVYVLSIKIPSPSEWNGEGLAARHITLM
jgi:hypothetical protein